MIRSFLTVSSGTLASRLLGFVRDSMIAALLGTGAVADAFLAAFQLVNVARRLLSEGALNAALVPAWLRLREGGGADAAAAFAGRALGTISGALFAATLLIGVAMPLVIAALAPGFAGETVQLAVTDARLMLPYLAFAGPATVLLALASAREVDSVSSAVKAPRSNNSRTIGSLNAINPSIAGSARPTASSIARDSACAMPALSPPCSARVNSGIITVPMATPTMPSGSSIRRLAK